VSEEEALKFVTINPAKQLRIDNRVGSIEVGKDADLSFGAALHCQHIPSASKRGLTEGDISTGMKTGQ